MPKIPENRLVIIADDLTGALDASGYLAGKGFSVRVFPAPVFDIGNGVTVINTDSRSDPPAIAAEKLRQLAKRLKGEAVFKKIDSTLRGNIVVEIGAILEVLPFDKVIVCPAFPAAGRTIENGKLKVNGIPVARTDFRHDPLNPVSESFIPSLFEHEGYHAGIVTLADIEKGPEHLSAVFSARTERILICDATEESHLRNVALAVAHSEGRILPVGSGGLAREMSVWLETASENRNTPAISRPGPALIVVGSRHAASTAQLLKANKEGSLALLNMDVATIKSIDGKSLETERLALEAGSFLEKGKSVAITSAFSPLAAGRSKDVAAALAGVAGILLKSYPIAGLFLSGGDTATAVCRELGVKVIRVYDEIQPGIPAGEIEIDKHQIRLVTKAGGFGGETAIMESMRYLEGGIL